MLPLYWSNPSNTRSETAPEHLYEHHSPSQRLFASLGCYPARMLSASSNALNRDTTSSQSTVLSIPSCRGCRSALITILILDIYILSSVLIGSLLIFAGRDISYIDALVFAGGACTGAGLNPVDLTTLNTWQQVQPFFQ